MQRNLEGDDELQKPEDIKSHLTARELQARDPAKNDTPHDDTVEERHAHASSKGSKGEPAITDKEPARGDRGLPETRTEKLQHGPKGHGSRPR